MEVGLTCTVRVEANITKRERSGPSFSTFLFVYRATRHDYYLMGQCHLLALSTLSGTPVGILFDRMEECPEEVQNYLGRPIDPDLLRRVLAYLRSQHPDGV